MPPLALTIAPALPADHPEIARVWEASVRATHHFLAEDDLAFHKQRMVPEYLPAVDLWAAWGPDGQLAGFLGTAGRRIEMLFVDPGFRGRGVGRQLVAHALERQGARELDVNEQNTAAVRFYENMGFRVAARSPRDGAGRPYPLLHMRWHGDKAAT